MCESLNYRISSTDLKVRVSPNYTFPHTFVPYYFVNLESVAEILWCYHSYKTSLGALSIAAICLLVSYRIKFGILLGNTKLVLESQKFSPMV